MCTKAGVGRSLIDWGQTLSIPGEWALEQMMRSFVTTRKPGRVDNCDSEVLEVARRCGTVFFQIALSPMTVGLMMSGKVLMQIGDYLTGETHYYIEGCQEVEMENEFSIMLMNVGMLWSIPWLDGLTPPGERIDQLYKKIEKHNFPGILIFNEASFRPGKNLAAKLKAHYAHIYTRIAIPKITTTETSLFIACKYPVENVQYKEFSNKEGIHRGIFIVETPKAMVVATHFPSGDDAASDRKQMLAWINSKIAKIGNHSEKPVFLVGDLNIKDDDEYNSSGLLENYWDARNDGRRHIFTDENTATCTNWFRAYSRGQEDGMKEDEFEDIDCILRATFIEEDTPRIESMAIERITGFKKGKTPLSDHHGLLAMITL